MKRFFPPAGSAVAILLTLSLLALAAPGCTRHAKSRDASSLSVSDRTLLDQYEAIRAALALDDLRGAKRAAAALAASLKPADAKAPAPPALSPAEDMAASATFDKARQAFQALSAIIVTMVEGMDGYYVFNSPFPPGAQWVQRTPEVDNPYVGKAMHDQGTLKK